MPPTQPPAHHPPSPPALPPLHPSPPKNTPPLDHQPAQQDPSLAHNLDDDGGGDGDQEEFYVDYIVRHRYFPERLCWLYEVKWSGFGDEHNTWERAEALQHLPAWEIFLKSNTIKSRIIANRENSSEPTACSTPNPTDLPTRIENLQEPLPIRKCVLKTLEKKKPLSRELRLEKRKMNSASKASNRKSPRNLAPQPQRTNTMLNSEQASKPSNILSTQCKSARKRALGREGSRQSESSSGSGSGPQIVGLLQGYLQSFLGPMEDVYRAACQSIRWDDRRVPYMSGSTVVIYGRDSGYSKRSESECGSGYKFETVALWYCLTRAGATRARFGALNRTNFVLKSVILDKVKPEAVDKLFIHRSHLHELSRIGGLSELIKQQHHFVEIYAFGSSVCTSEKDIRPIFTWGSVVIPTMNCVLHDISPDGTNAFTDLIEVQRGNPTSQMFLTLATFRRLVHESQSARSGMDERVQVLVGSVLDDLRRRYSGKVTISPAGRRCLWEATFAVLEDTPGSQEEEDAEWDEHAEVELIVEALNKIRQLLFEQIRKFVVVVEDDSAWLGMDGKQASSMTKGIEVLSISEAFARLSKPGSVL